MLKTPALWQMAPPREANKIGTDIRATESANAGSKIFSSIIYSLPCLVQTQLELLMQQIK